MHINKISKSNIKLSNSVFLKTRSFNLFMMFKEIEFVCNLCSRRFLRQKGLETHQRQVAGKCNDEEYIRKRVANLKSVQKSRDNNKKAPIEDLVKQVEDMTHEAEEFENFLKENFPNFEFIKLKEKLKNESALTEV